MQFLNFISLKEFLHLASRIPHLPGFPLNTLAAASFSCLLIFSHLSEFLLLDLQGVAHASFSGHIHSQSDLISSLF